ncbi:MAG: polysaccharide deacetylase family protein [Synergistetes bacterium]|nr:MAG: Polysaccharide deacetylase [bacterium 42_11]MBC7332010.1 polysaccharide deacetylase family protein [Synergistota bacterium]MDK2871790.1 peptidoglycan-N-acetylglucosamine deacetylase [bacterium]
MSINVFLSVDFDADSAERLYYAKCPVKISKAQFDLNVGLDRLLTLFKKYEIKTTFFVPAWVAQEYPHHVEKIVRDEHEIGLHGYKHEKLNELSREKELELLHKSLKILQSFSDINGFRKPYWEISENTLDILTELKIIYDSSLKGCDFPYIQKTRKGALVELPIEDFLDDWVLFEIDRKGPEEVLSMWKGEFESSLHLNIPYISIIVHPSCIGRASRLTMLEKLINHILTQGGAFKRGIEIVSDFLKMTGNKVTVPPLF